MRCSFRGVNPAPFKLDSTWLRAAMAASSSERTVNRVESSEIRKTASPNLARDSAESMAESCAISAIEGRRPVFSARTFIRPSARVRRARNSAPTLLAGSRWIVNE